MHNRMLYFSALILTLLLFAACTPIAAPPASKVADAPASATESTVVVRPIAPQTTDCAPTFVAHDLDHTTMTDDGMIRMFEANGSGVAAGDLDNDGDLDLVLGNLDAPNTILWNEGALTFRTDHFGEPNSRAITLVDIDGDQWLDIVLTRNTGAVNYWHNQGDGAFVRRTLPGVAAPAYALNWADFDLDGDLDLVVASYDAGLLADRGTETLLHNVGGVVVYTNNDGKFSGATLATDAQALVVAVFDVNGDQLPDILVGNDFDIPDYAWLNTPAGWKAAHPFVQTTHSTMSIDMGDINNDGRPEFFQSDMKPYAHDAATAAAWAPVMPDMHMGAMSAMSADPQMMENALLMRDDSGSYYNLSSALGVDATGWSWSGKFGDLDNDGYLDLYIANGFIEERLLTHLPNYELVEENQAFRNTGSGHFEPMPAWALGSTRSGRSMVLADFDADGDLDIVINNLRAAAQLFENRLCSGSSLQLDLTLANAQNRTAIGAQAILHTDRGDLVRDVRAASGYLSGDAPRLYFGFPNDAVLHSLTVRWPDGAFTTVDSIKANTLMHLTRFENP